MVILKAVQDMAERGDVHLLVPWADSCFQGSSRALPLTPSRLFPGAVSKG